MKIESLKHAKCCLAEAADAFDRTRYRCTRADDAITTSKIRDGRQAKLGLKVEVNKSHKSRNGRKTVFSEPYNDFALIEIDMIDLYRISLLTLMTLSKEMGMFDEVSENSSEQMYTVETYDLTGARGAGDACAARAARAARDDGTARDDCTERDVCGEGGASRARAARAAHAVHAMRSAGAWRAISTSSRHGHQAQRDRHAQPPRHHRARVEDVVEGDGYRHVRRGLGDLELTEATPQDGRSEGRRSRRTSAAGDVRAARAARAARAMRMRGPRRGAARAARRATHASRPAARSS